MAASAKRTIRTLAIWIFALCLLIPLTACAYEALAATAGDESTEAAATSSENADATEKESAATNPAQAENASKTEASDATDAASDSATDSAAKAEADSSNSGAADPTDGAKTEGAPTTATIMYYENVSYDDGDTEPDEDGRVLLGTYELTDVHVGQTLNAWNYVVDIPGHFFWDGWPQNLTLTDNPSDNVIKLFYFKLWNNEYTVNYYLMENADLTADNWKDALAPDDVKFIKMGSETFTNQRFDQLVKGDAYEYKIDGTYVVDTYPSEIRVGVNPDDNVINVLYVPDSANLPDDIEVPDDATPPSDTTQPGTGGSNKPEATPDAGGSATPSLPGDTEFDKDEITDTLPDKDEVINDFIESGDAQDKVEITDEMIENPVSKSDADYVKNVYETGLKEGEKLAQTGDTVALIAIASVAVVAAAVGIIAFVMRRRTQRSEKK